MPLKHSPSKKAFVANLKTEMKHGKPQDQSLAIAYSIKRRAKKANGGRINPHERGVHDVDPFAESGGQSTPGTWIREQQPEKMSQAEKDKRNARNMDLVKSRHSSNLKTLKDMPKANIKGMAEGGAISAKSEKRPMPEDKHNDHEDVALNSSDKPSHDDSWSDHPTLKQVRKPSHVRLSEPKMVESGVIRAKLRSDEHDFMAKDAPMSDKAQPSKAYDEHEAKKKGPDSKDLHMKMMAKGGKVKFSENHQENLPLYESDQGTSRQGSLVRSANRSKSWAADERSYSPSIEKSMAKDRMAEARKVQKSKPRLAEGGMLDLEDEDREALDHHKAVDDEYGGSAEADEAPEDSPLDGLDDEETPAVDEFMAGHFAEGGHIEESEDNYADDGDHDSIAAAIMSRRERLHDEIDSGAHDEDLAAAYAEGGEVDMHLRHEEQPNNEDQLSFEALKKENYNSSDLDMEQPEDSNEEGDEREHERSDKHDRVSAIMSKMKSKSKR